MEVALESVNVKIILPFLESLVSNDYINSMLANYVSAIKASFVLYDLPYDLLDHPKIKLFQKSLRINRPSTFVSHNIIDLPTLEQISLACDGFKCAQVLRAVFPHSLTCFDLSRHLTAHGSVLFSQIG